MIRCCDGTDPYLLGADGEPCACGLRFSDGDYSVLYPHMPLAVFPLTDQEREDWYAFLGVAGA
jgi:hypothetical protein